MFSHTRKLKTTYRSAIIPVVAMLVFVLTDTGIVRAQGDFQVFPRKDSSGFGDKFDYIHAAVDCPMSFSVPPGFWVASPVGLGSGEDGLDTWIESGWMRFAPSLSQTSCTEEYCAFVSWESDVEGSGFELVQGTNWSGGARPWFMSHRDLSNCQKRVYKAWAFYHSVLELTPQGGIEFSDDNFETVVNGVEAASHAVTMSTHRHNENTFSIHDSSCAANGTTTWCYDEVSPNDGGTVSFCSGAEWTITVP